MFVDDDGALNDEDEKLYNSEFLRREKEEEERAKVEYERVSAEQERLAQLQQVSTSFSRYHFPASLIFDNNVLFDLSLLCLLLSL